MEESKKSIQNGSQVGTHIFADTPGLEYNETNFRVSGISNSKYNNNVARLATVSISIKLGPIR